MSTTQAPLTLAPERPAQDALTAALQEAGVSWLYVDPVWHGAPGPGGHRRMSLSDSDAKPFAWNPVTIQRTITLHHRRLDAPLGWRQPREVVVGKKGDLFHEQVPDGFIVWAWMTMCKTPWHTFQILTDQPERMQDFARRWNDLNGEGDYKGVRGPAATREAHPSGRGQLFAAYLDELVKAEGENGEPPGGAAWPTFDWMEGPRWWTALPLFNVCLNTPAPGGREGMAA